MVRSTKSAKRWPKSYVFLLAILLEKGERLALGLIYLGSLFARLDEFIINVTRSLGSYDVVMHVNSSFLQIFI